MKYNLYIISFFVLSALIAIGCAPIYYPSTPNTPMLQEAGETQLTGRVGSSGGELQAARAINDRVFLFGGILGGADPDSEEAVHPRHLYLEAGGGYFTRPAGPLVLEGGGGIGLGGGRGDATRPLTGNRFRAEGTYVKPFLQGNIAIQSRVIDLGVVNRFSLIRFAQISEVTGDREVIIDNPSTPLFWEPSLFVQLGWDRLKFSLNFGSSGPIAGDPDFDWNPLYVSTGVSFRFGGTRDDVTVID